MKLRRIRLEEETVDISERLRQIGHLETSSMLSQRLAPEDVVDAQPAPEPVPVEPHKGRIYVAGVHGEPHFKSATWLQPTRRLSA